MASLSKQNPYDKFVQDQMIPGKFASAEFMALGMGPPMLTSLTGSSSGETVFPLGITQNFSVSQNKAVARIFEIGSKRSYMFPGKTIGAVTFGRPYYHGPSLLRLMMAYYKSSSAEVPFDSVFPNQYSDLHNVRVPPGYENIFINLASDLFDQPHGELVVMKDTDNVILGAFYLEQCYIPGHNWAVDAQGIIFQEGVQVQYERLMPIDVSTAYPFEQVDWSQEIGSDTFLSNLNSSFGATLTSAGSAEGDARGP